MDAFGSLRANFGQKQEKRAKAEISAGLEASELSGKVLDGLARHAAGDLVVDVQTAVPSVNPSPESVT